MEKKIATNLTMCPTYFFVDVTEKANLSRLIQKLHTNAGGLNDLNFFFFFYTSEYTIYHSEDKHYSLQAEHKK